MRSFLLCFLLLSAVLVKIYAIPASPNPILIRQPDGSMITVLIKGDEFYNYKSTLDGYQIKENTQGVFEYVRFAGSGTLELTGVKVSELGKRSPAEMDFVKTLTPNVSYINQSVHNRTKRVASTTKQVESNAFPLTGSPKSLVILVNFKDLSYVTPNSKQAFTELLNKKNYSENGGTGSAKDYFIESSYGAFSPDFVVVGPYTLPENVEFYGENVSESDKNPRQMVVDACKLADDAGVDFNDYDTDGDGVVDNVFIYYAGNNEAEGANSNTIWPHRWSLANSSFKFDGKVVYDYACTSELRGTGNSMCGIGTFCHEFGHVLGLPDYYATNDAKHHTLSYWHIMDAGGYLNQGRTPPSYSAYDRFQLDWLKPQELIERSTITLGALTESNTAYLITKDGNHNLNGSNPNPTEFFVLENRNRIGFDSYLPNSGLLITRINYNASTWRSNGPNNSESLMGVDIMEADQIASSTTLGGDVFPGSASVTSYEPVLVSGTKINKPITFISRLVNGDISFRFKGGKDVPDVSVSRSLKKFNTVQGTPSKEQVLALKYTNLESSISVKFKTKAHYEIKLAAEGNTAWRKELNITAVSKALDSTLVAIRYNPSSPSFDGLYDHSDALEVTSVNAQNLSIDLAGSSSRAVYVVKPTQLAADAITLSGFKANWENVFDASGYYLSLYSMFDGESMLTESFDKGLEPSFGWIINSESATSSTAYSGLALPGIWLIKTGDYIQTEQYDLPCTGLSFFASALSVAGSELIVEAWNGSGWNLIDSYPISDSFKGVKKYSFLAEKNYTKFRISYKFMEGQVAIDDVSVTLSKDVEYIVKNQWVEQNSYTVDGLMPSMEYYFKVKASDKTYNPTTEAILYENITDYSDLFKVKTLVDPKSKSLRVEIGVNGKLYVFLSDLEMTLFIYTFSGNLVKAVKPNSLKFDITNFINPNQLYILESGARRVKIFSKK